MVSYSRRENRTSKIRPPSKSYLVPGWSRFRAPVPQRWLEGKNLLSVEWGQLSMLTGSSSPVKGLSGHLLSDPLNWRCQGWNWGPAAHQAGTLTPWPNLQHGDCCSHLELASQHEQFRGFRHFHSRRAKLILPPLFKSWRLLLLLFANPVLWICQIWYFSFEWDSSQLFGRDKQNHSRLRSL